jgi:glycosyltransferase involved in cell wall biosynthesis
MAYQSDHIMSLKVTIGVCAKNSEKTIRETIDSIINQQYPAELIQLVVVDGCSKDKTTSIVTDSTGKTKMKVEIYSDGGRGLGAARQTVVNKATGKYIIFVDADVKLFDDFVKMHVKFMEENPSIGVAFGTPMYQEGTLVSSVWNLYQYATGGFWGNDATVYRPEALRSVGGFDSNIKGAGEDYDLLNRIQTRGFLISVNRQARWLHKSRETLIDFLAERSWMGYGGHYFFHKMNRRPTWRHSFIAAFGVGLKMASKAYRQTHRKISFLVPFQLVLGNIFWWFGLIKGHIDGYGEKKSVGGVNYAREE